MYVTKSAAPRRENVNGGLPETDTVEKQIIHDRQTSLTELIHPKLQRVVKLSSVVEGGVDSTTINDPIMRRAAEVQIASFGQVPSQLFRSPHLRRLTRDEAAAARWSPYVLSQACDGVVCSHPTDCTPCPQRTTELHACVAACAPVLRPAHEAYEPCRAPVVHPWTRHHRVCRCRRQRCDTQVPIHCAL